MQASVLRKCSITARTRPFAAMALCTILGLLWPGCRLASPVGETTETAYVWRTLAGQPGGLGNVDGLGEAARFCQPCGIACDTTGNLFVADYYNYAIRKISSDGAVTTVAGSVGEAGSSDGTGNDARFDKPAGVAADAAGNLFVADSGNHTIRKIAADGTVSTLAGLAGFPGYADGYGTAARFRYPQDVACDAAGNIFVADGFNHMIRKIRPDGTVTTLAGAPPGKSGQPAPGSTNGRGAAAQFRGPRGIAVDTAGNVFVADTENATVRKIRPDGTVTTLAGTAGKTGSANGQGAAARFVYPQGIAVDAKGNVYVADAGNRDIRRITPKGGVTTLTNAPALFLSPRGVAVNPVGNVAVTDNELQTVTLLTPHGRAIPLAGSASAHGSADGRGAAVRFNRPCGIAADERGNLAVTDTFGHTLRAVTPDGVVTTLAGRASSSGATDGAGGAARFSWPAGTAFDRAGNIYIADAGNHTLRKVTPDGRVITLAGRAGESGATDGAGNRARFAGPAGVALDRTGTLYVADRLNHTLRKVAPDGTVSTFAGASGKIGHADGARGIARFNNPSGVAVDALGTVYVADTGNHTVRKITPAGEVSTLAGCAGLRGNADGTGAFARFNGPAAVAVDRTGHVFVADRDNHTIRRIAPDGTVSTLGGQPNQMTAADGRGCEARFAQPSGIAVDDAGVLYVADACNNRITAGVPYSARRSAWLPVTEKAAPAGCPELAETKTASYVWDVFAGRPGVAGTADGHGTEARFRGPQGIAFDAHGNLIVAEGDSRALRVIAPDGAVTTRTLADCRWSAPIGIAANATGTCFVTDAAHAVWEVNAAGHVSKLACKPHTRDRFGAIIGIAADAAGNAYVADTGSRTVRKIAPDGEVSIRAGAWGIAGAADGTAADARFALPSVIAADRKGRLVVADETRLRTVDANGTVWTLTSDARIGRIDGLAVDAAGNAYAADRTHHAIWKVTPRGDVVKLAGSERAMGGSGWLITGLAVDREGRVYVSDSVGHCILRGSPAR